MTAPPPTVSADRKLPRLALAATLLLVVAPLVAFGVIRQQRVNEARAWARRVEPLLVRIARENRVEVRIDLLPTGEIGVETAWLSWHATPDDVERQIRATNPPRISYWKVWGPHLYPEVLQERERAAKGEGAPPAH